MDKSCRGTRQGGHPCHARPLRDEAFCFWHHPDHAEAAADARRLGGLRRRREGTLQGAYDFEGLASAADIRRLLDIAVMDALGLDNSVARIRTLIAAASAATKLLEVSEMEDRLASLESALAVRLPGSPRRS